MCRKYEAILKTQRQMKIQLKQEDIEEVEEMSVQTKLLFFNRMINIEDKEELTIKMLYYCPALDVLSNQLTGIFSN